MAVYDRNDTNLPAVSSSQLPSVDVSSILIKSLQTAMGNVPSESEDLADQITEGINNSDLVKQKKSDVGKSTNSNSPLDALLKSNNESVKKQEKANNDYLLRKEKRELTLLEKQEKLLEKKVDTAMKEANTFSKNPLKGFNDFLENGIKKGFGSLFKLSHKTLGEIGKDAKNGFKGVASTLAMPAKLIGTGFATIKNLVASQSSSLVESNNVKDAAKTSQEKETKTESLTNQITEAINNSDLIDEEKKRELKEKEKEVKQETKEANVEKKRDAQANELAKSNMLVNTSLGKIVGSVATVALAAGLIYTGFPIAYAHIKDTIIGIKQGFIKFGAVVESFINTLGPRAKSMAVELLSSISLRSPITGKPYRPFQGNLTEEQQERLAEINKTLNSGNTKELENELKKKTGLSTELIGHLSDYSSEEEFINKAGDIFARNGMTGTQITDMQERAREVWKQYAAGRDPAQIAKLQEEKNQLLREGFGEDAVFTQENADIAYTQALQGKLKGMSMDAYEARYMMEHGDDRTKLAVAESLQNGDITLTELKKSSRMAIAGHAEQEALGNTFKQLGSDIVDSTKTSSRVTSHDYTNANYSTTNVMTTVNGIMDSMGN